MLCKKNAGARTIDWPNKGLYQEALEPLGVAVVIEAQHMCMQMRGIENKILYNYLSLPEHLKK
jgi:hypothetical protein